MDRRIDIATARAELDDIIRSSEHDNAPTIVERDGNDVAVILSMQAYRLATAPRPDAFDRIRADAAARNMPPMSMDEIDGIVAEVRRELREEKAQRR